MNDGKLYRVWIGYYDREKFRPHHWTQNPQMVQTLMQIAPPLPLSKASLMAKGFNKAEIVSVGKLREVDLAPRMWAFVVEDGVEVKQHSLYRLVSCEEPTVKLAPSAN